MRTDDRMWRTMVLALALTLTCAFAQGASAAMLDGPAWVVGTLEDFSAYDPPPGGADPENISFIGKLIGQPSGAQRNCSYDPWDNWNLAQYRGYKDGTNNVANLQVSSATNPQRAAWRGMVGAGAGDRYQRVSFRVRTALTAASDYTAEARMSNNDAQYPDADNHSNGIPGWDVSNLSLRPHVRTSWDQTDPLPEWIGPDVDISGGGWHTMDIVYDLVTGDAEWYKDGALVATLPNDPALKGYFLGRPTHSFEFWQKAGGVQAGGSSLAPGVLFDDVTTLSAIPEPATLALLALAGVPTLRRRRSA